MKRTPWQELGFEQDDMEAIAANMVAAFDWWNGPPTGQDSDVESWTSDACRERMAVFAMASLGYQLSRSPLDNPREIGRRLAEAVKYYFFGAWRDNFRFLNEPMNRKRARAELPWSSYYREGLGVAASLSDWAAVDQLVGWPGPDLRFDEGSDDRTPEDNAYQIWLASRLRDEPLSDSAAQREMIERGSRRRPKMLLAAADALLAGDAAALCKNLTAYLREYRRREIRPNRVDFGVCLDGTTLWHLARRRKLGELSVPEDLMILIARP